MTISNNFLGAQASVWLEINGCELERDTELISGNDYKRTGNYSRAGLDSTFTIRRDLAQRIIIPSLNDRHSLIIPQQKRSFLLIPRQADDPTCTLWLERAPLCPTAQRGVLLIPTACFFFAGEDWWNIRGVIVGDTLSHKNQQLRFGFYVCGRDLFGV
jgi:hypothetical protein